MDLAAEFSVYRDRVEPKHVRWLRRQGVGELGLLSGTQWSFGIAEIEVLDKGAGWGPMPGGREAMVLYVEDDIGVDDLLAFFPKAPEAVMRRVAHATYAGIDHLLWCRDWCPEDDFHLRRDLLDWMAHGFTGCAIVDWSDPHILQRDFQSLRAVHVDDAALAAKLHAALSRPHVVPPIMVAEPRDGR